MMKIHCIKLSILFTLSLLSGLAHSISVGFNQAWFNIDYGTQYLDGKYDEAEVSRIFRMTSEASAKHLRLWFFETSNFPMVEWKENQMVGLRSDFIRNVIKTLKIAKFYQVKVYMTLLDAHSYRPDILDKASLAKLRQVYQKEGGEIFLNKVLAPLLSAIEAEGLSSSIGRIDLLNEMDTVVNRLGFDHRWDGAARMLCQWRSFIHGFPGFKSIPVTFSLRLHPLVIHPLNLLHDKGPLACADYLDFHSYNNQGEIHRCRQLRAYSKLNKKELILGEFGQGFFTHRYDNNLHLKNTELYIKSAEKCGFKEALAWRLSDIRPGMNKEARYSFEAYGQMRPAYWLIQKNNQR